MGFCYLKSIVLADEGSGEDGDVEDDAQAIKNRQSEDELKEGLLEVKS